MWEVAIKRSLGRLQAPGDLESTLLGGGAIALPVKLEHAAVVETPAWHHRDPFDRLLVGQALVEGAALVSGNATLDAYGVTRVW